ncbi:MAG: SsrA-binding protein SmpB [Patescibacteria group bacterium]|nr:SsrA-binding protein SmpB [Patescibacteria group bacterium]
MILVKNKKAHYDYTITKTIQAGIVLIGAEVKSLRNKSASLQGSYIKIIGKEAWLINARINPYKYSSNENYDPRRTRKILLTKKQIFKLFEYVEYKNYSLVPLSIELVNNKIKVNIGIGKGKKEFEKRDKIKKRDLKRQMAKNFKQTKLKV